MAADMTIAADLSIPDETALTGRYYVFIDADTHEAWSAALEHQLGLKLEPRKVPTETIVIDTAARPSEN